MSAPNFFSKVPLLTDRQEGLAREHGVCPRCDRQALVELGQGHGMRFVSCCHCQTVVVLPPATGSDRLLMYPGARDYGRAYLAQRHALATLPGIPSELERTLAELRATLAAVGVVGQVDGHDVIRRSSVLELVERRIK